MVKKSQEELYVAAFYLGTPVKEPSSEAIPAFVHAWSIAMTDDFARKQCFYSWICSYPWNADAGFNTEMLGIAMMAGCLAVILVQMQGTQKVAVQEVEDDDF